MPVLLQPIAHALLQAQEELNETFAYARGELLTEIQMKNLKSESVENAEITVQKLIEDFSQQVEKAIIQLKNMDEATST